ncbi:hypothetical protein OSTOST_04496, partial [Ostertagia ostertagi]
MDCIVAASTGALKGINLRENSFTNLLPIKTLAPKQDEITSMIWSGSGQGAFLLFYMEKLHACISNENGIRNVDEHLKIMNVPLGHRILDKYSTMVVELAMPHPLPQYDDKDRLGHDVVDLLLNKFPFMLKYSDERKKVMEKFTTWMHRAATDASVDRLKWPVVKDESYVQSCVWYLMALHHYRSSNYNEIETYSKLFLTSGHATLESRVTAGAWAVLAYTSVYRVFQ